MSSCAASFATCCPAALSASATSVSSPTAVAPPCCPSADNCFMSQRKILHCYTAILQSETATVGLPQVWRSHAFRRAHPRRPALAPRSSTNRQLCRMNRCLHQCPLRARRHVQQNSARTPIQRIDDIPQNASHTHPPGHLPLVSIRRRRLPHLDSISCSTKDLLRPIQLT